MRLLALRQAGAPAPHRGPVLVVRSVGLSLRHLIEASNDTACGRRRPISVPSFEVGLWRRWKRSIGRNSGHHRYGIIRVESGLIRFSGRHPPQDPHIFGTGPRHHIRVLQIPLILRNVGRRGNWIERSSASANAPGSRTLPARSLIWTWWCPGLPFISKRRNSGWFVFSRAL